MIATAPSRVHRAVEQVMGMPISLALRGRHAGTTVGEDAWRRVIAELREVDRVFSTYRPDSVINRLDRGELTVGECPPEVAEVLALGARATAQSGGAFAVHLPHAGRTRLDPSGVVKGWATERAARHLRSLEDTDVCLSAGGDLVAHVADPDRPAWRIGIEDPFDPRRVITVLPIRAGAVATSGAARRGAHVIDARTGRAAAGVAQVSVVGDSLTWADIDATAAYAQGRDALRWLRTRHHRTVVVVWPDGLISTVAEQE